VESKHVHGLSSWIDAELRIMKKILLRGLAGLAILALGIWFMNGLIGMKGTPPVKPRPATARLVKTMVAAPDTWSPTVELEGRVQALHRVTVFSEVSGMLPLGGKEFREGVRFEEGEVMLSLDDSEVRANLVAQRSQWLQLLAGNLADLQIDFPARAEVWRAYIQAIRADESVATLPEAASDRERLYLTSKGIVSGYHSILASQERLDKFHIQAPFSGTLTMANVEPGSMVRAGQPLGTLIGNDQYEVKAAIHARHLSVVSEGDPVTLTEESGKLVASGTVARIAGHVDEMSQSASVYCQIRAVDGATLRDGRFLSGLVSGAPVPHVLPVPEELLEGQEAVAVYQVLDQRLAMLPVSVIHKDADQALIRGLEGGEVLLAEPVSGAFEGMLVEPVTH
jgi:RND family efflux transporter MFP subunit